MNEQTKANDVQAGGDHYKNMGVQPWEVIDTWPAEQRIGYYRGTLLSYTMRMGNKDNRLIEAQKQHHLTQKLAEVVMEVFQERIALVQKRFEGQEMEMDEAQLNNLAEMIRLEAEGLIELSDVWDYDEDDDPEDPDGEDAPVPEEEDVLSPVVCEGSVVNFANGRAVNG